VKNAVKNNAIQEITFILAFNNRAVPRINSSTMMKMLMDKTTDSVRKIPKVLK
jgi:hypothetical protein